ncbi:TMEM175 family protein [uncultured Jatrophihabitans sp.]|uniref:TMEM175 family protein n=1 Tax=uncultured Jatrophihabitans sp. TaxID=1610747 RepID=UPI0035CBC868
MRTGRLEAFSDGVLAIIITIMVLELHDPEGHDWHDLQHAVPTLLTYLLSFAYIGIYWTNHHHMIAATRRVTGGVLWANLHLLFWLSLVPWTTSWLGSSHFAQVPAAVYGISLLMPAIAYFILQRVIIHDQGPDSLLAAALGRDRKGKMSPVLYAAGIVFALVDLVPVSMAFYTLVALMWIVPDRRVESRLTAGVGEP